MKENYAAAGGIKEKKAWKVNGFFALLLVLLSLTGIGFLIWAMVMGPRLLWLKLTGLILLSLLAFVLLCGLVVVPPNVSRVITFFGKYSGVIRESGLWLIVPFSNSKKVSLRVRNFNTEKLKVNDDNGNPIEIAAVVVFQVVDSAKAIFDVNNYEEFVEIQSETSLRHVAAQYPYDSFDENVFSLRSNGEEVSRQLKEELQARLAVAGVEVIEARLTHLAYATEIASAMLQRQQAAAILSARQIIVDGAVGMAQMAINKLEEEAQLDIDEERKLNMINNLMVSIITDRSSQPVINVGSMY